MYCHLAIFFNRGSALIASNNCERAYSLFPKDSYCPDAYVGPYLKHRRVYFIEEEYPFKILVIMLHVYNLVIWYAVSRPQAGKMSCIGCEICVGVSNLLATAYLWQAAVLSYCWFWPRVALIIPQISRNLALSGITPNLPLDKFNLQWQKGMARKLCQVVSLVIFSFLNWTLLRTCSLKSTWKTGRTCFFRLKTDWSARKTSLAWWNRKL